MADEKLDVVVIGGGPGGYVAAIRVAQLGGRVALVERDTVGGTCVNRGCIPTKALLASVQVLAQCRDAAKYGVETGPVSANLELMLARKDKIVSQMVRGVEYLLKKAEVRVIKGVGSIAGPGAVDVQVEGGAAERLTARAIVVATGSEPMQLPALPFDEERIISSTQALRLVQVPDTIAIVGAGAIGVEFAHMFGALGSQVTVVEMLPQLLPAEDKEIADLLLREYRKRKIKVLTGTTVEKATQQEGGIALLLSNGETIAAQIVLVAAGRSFNTGAIGLDRVGVELSGRAIAVDERMATSVPGVYAIGDVAGGPLLAHVAFRQGIVAAENIMGGTSTTDYRVVPRTVWTWPEVASVGMSEQQAIDAGHSVRVGKFPFRALGKAVADGHSEGLVKLVADQQTDELLGCQMIGPHVTDLIAEIAVAMELESTVEDVARTIHAHPSLPEAVLEAAHVLQGHPIHI